MVFRTYISVAVLAVALLGTFAKADEFHSPDVVELTDSDFKEKVRTS
jgi:hypothetical protein